MELIPMPVRVPRVAIIDKDPVFLRKLEDGVESHGWQACASSDLAHVGGFTAHTQADLVIIDVGQRSERAAAWHALDVLKHVRETRAIPVILCTVPTAVLTEQLRTLQEYGVAVLSKPCRTGDVVRKAAAVLRQHRAHGPWRRR
jgi:DNA-binding response OmpR family regulator